MLFPALLFRSKQIILNTFMAVNPFEKGLNGVCALRGVSLVTLPAV